MIVPDRHGQGTNALLLTPPDVIDAGVRRGLVRAPRARSRARPAWPKSPTCQRSGWTSTRRTTSPRCGRAPGTARARARCSKKRPRLDRAAGAARAARGPPGRRPRGADHATGVELLATDVLVVAHKVVSKAEGRVVRLADVTPGERVRWLAAEHGKDPRHVEVVLSEAAAARPRGRRPPDLPHPPRLRVRERGRGRLQRVRAGLARPAARRPGRARRGGCARALPDRPAVIITDSFGRAWRHGQCEVAIGVAGLRAAGGLARAAGAAGPRTARDRDRDRRRGRGRRRPGARQGLARARGAAAGAGASRDGRRRAGRRGARAPARRRPFR